jgi:ornithine cyclodeaminase/alanine dehydrogenase-like protein (mu-crystallin family)
MAIFNDSDTAYSLRTHGLRLDADKGESLPDNASTLPEILAGHGRGRMSAGETTCFLNNLGMGFQFAVAGHVVYEKARLEGIGRELPTDWFTQTEPS